MANLSVSINRGAAIDSFAAGVQSVTTGTLAPGAGDVEIRFSTTNGLTKLEAKNLIDVLWRFIENPAGSNTIPL